MKKFVCVMLTLLLCVSLLAACGGDNADSGVTDSAAPEKSDAPETDDTTKPAENDRTYKVGYVNLSDNDENCYLATMTCKEICESDAFKEAVGAPQNIEVVALDSQLDVQKQQTAVENLITQQVDMIFLIGADTEANTTAVKACNEVGIPIFMVATTASGGDYSFLGWDEYEYGAMQARWAVDNLPEGTNICYMDGTSGREAFDKREAGFKDIMEAERPDCVFLSTQASENTTAEESMQITEDWITQFGADLECVVTQSNNTVIGAIEALKAANMIDDVIVLGGIHVGTWDVEMLRKGEQDYAVSVSFGTLGELCADVAQRCYNGEPIEKEEMMELYHITIDNVDEYFPQ
ncbi:MAG: sugar ABC transporter substrate-binding protein [Christensenellales bacterium]